MEAKDTVMDELEMKIVLNKASWKSPTIPLSYHHAIAKAQAEITAPIFLKEGIREVVELWIKRCPECGNYFPKNLDGTRTLKCSYCNWNGQAKLKEWGIDG